MRLLCLWIFFAIFVNDNVVDCQQALLGTVSVSSSEDSSKTAIEGFGTSFSCSVNTCLSPNQKVTWLKDNKVISENRDIVATNERLSIQYTVNLDNEHCSQKCSSDNRQCSKGSICRPDDDMCCSCKDEEYKLVVTNVTFNDRGRYRCQLLNGNSVTILLQVVECCQSRNMSPQCMPMCQPGLIETHKFDPIPCQKEFSKLLHCSTEGGNISHTHCCRLHFVPAFCWEYCSGTEDDFSRANSMCIHWMPEIFQCYEQAFLPFPGPPESLIVNTVNSSALEACWDAPDRNSQSIQFYTVRYQEIPRFPMLSGNIPFAPDGDLDEDKEMPPESSEVSSGPTDEEERPRFGPTLLNPNSRVQIASPSRSSSSAVAKSSGTDRRKKRQILTITTHNFATNETEVREYRYLELNSTDTCKEITNLKPSTQYFVYVTATNDYGTSLPSLRETATTGAIAYPNGTMPDIRQCCVTKNVSSQCLPKICDVEHPPSSVSAFDLALTCRSDFALVSPCLADGRDHTECCKDKGVIGECLKFCDGSVQQVGMSSVLCLSLDIQSIFSCLREGYVKLPSPPVNVTVTNIGSTSAIISWSPPVSNSDSVKNYSLFYRHSAIEQYIEVVDAISPFPLINLKPDTYYTVYVVTRGSFGSSLKSSIVSFVTSEPEYETVCPFGKPLLDANGEPLRCSSRLRCPDSHQCVSSETDDPDLKYCCPLDTPTIVGPPVRFVEPNLTACCLGKGIGSRCAGYCRYNITKSDVNHEDAIECVSHLGAFVECGVDFRNDVPCCEQAGVNVNVCLDFCRQSLKHSLTDYLQCFDFAEKILQCAHEGVLNLPGPPVNVSVEDSGVNWVTLHWQAPLQNIPVEHFEIIFNDTSKGNTTGRSITVTNLESNQLYVANVVSWNSKGSSLPSEEVNITLTPTKKTTSEDDTKPRPPNTIQKVWYKDDQANITWKWVNLSVNGKTVLDRYQFVVLYRLHPASNDLLAEAWRNVTTNVQFAVLSNLSAGQSYDIKVVAVNMANNVEGLPSEMTTILTANVESAPTVDITFSTSPPFRVKTPLVVTCTATGTPLPEVNLSHGNRHLAKGNGTTVFTFGSLNENDGDERLTCTADNGGTPVHKMASLIVHFPPTIAINSVAVASEDSTQPREVICRVKSLPKATVTWLFKADTDAIGFKEILVDHTNEQYERDGETETVKLEVLRLYDATAENVGTYMCRCCNDVGCSNATLKLEAEKPAQGPDDILDCCTKANVKQECMSICTSEINVSDYDKNINCVSEFTKLMGCAKDGINNKQCCVQRGVPENCLQFCDGSQMNISVATDCSNYQTDVLNCLLDGHKYLPVPPKGIVVETLADGRVNVSWKTPESKGLEQVTMYNLYYKAPGDKRYRKTQSAKTYVVLSDLRPNVNYSFTVQARSTHGWSHISPMYSSLVGSKSATAGSSTSAGVVLAIIFCLLLAVVVVLAFVYFSRRPYRLPTFLLKFGPNGRPKASVPSGAVAFENPGYDREGQIRGLPGGDNNETSNMTSAGNSNAANGAGDKGWEHARLETPEESPRAEQKGMKYTPLS